MIPEDRALLKGRYALAGAVTPQREVQMWGRVNLRLTASEQGEPRGLGEVAEALASPCS